MDSQFEGSYDSVNEYQYANGAMSPASEDPFNYSNIFNYKEPSVDLSSVEFSTHQPHASSPSNFTSTSSSSGANGHEAGSPDDNDSDSVLRYISQVLLEEDMDNKPCMLHDSLALQAAEKPFYEALGKNYPLSPDQPPLSYHYLDSPDDKFVGLFSNSKNNVTLTDPQIQPSGVAPFSFGSLASNNGIGGSVPSLPVGFNIFSDRESMIQFQKGVEEASKFLPKTSNLVIDLENITYPKEPKDTPPVAVKSEKEGSRIGRIHYRDDEDLEAGRSNKQSAISVEDADELSDMFDKVLLPPHKNEKGCYICSETPKEEHKHILQGLQPQETDLGEIIRYKRKDDKKNVVDLRTLLILGAQAVASDDRRTAAELLKQIRQHSSPLGDGSQRLAHSFANALEARLAGTGSQIYTSLSSKRTTAAQILKAYQLFVSFCPFKKISIMFSNFSTLKMSTNSKKLHIIDFGILYGFQWPALIHHLSDRIGGPPLLRITGIELPQPGFRPAERVEETGRRLAKYCERFGVPFEFHPIAQKWDTIKLEDLKLEKDEFVVVNCLYRFKNLLDDTIVADSPRDAVLSLIRKIKPNLFVHAVVNGSFNAPFFMTRFKEAVFFYSTLFDMFDTKVPRDNPERSMYEREFYGREIMNVVACEGTERVERPETYKQWQYLPILS
ncbi:hypothetical protein V2J09_017089 [Rumex salicifolius]